MSWFAHDSAHVDGESPQIGAGTRIWHGAHVMAGARIGRDVNIGQNVFIDADVVIGDGCKLQNNVNVYRGVTLADHVFCGPSMTFTNLSRPLPRAAIKRHHLLQRTDVGTGASFGADSVVVCGNRVGRFAFVAAGAVVIRDVLPFELVAGTPARHIGWVCVCGERLSFDGDRADCAHVHTTPEGATIPCERGYALEAGEVALVSDPWSGAPGFGD